jgi:quercetin dioxygenase-like cupin family protein
MMNEIPFCRIFVISIMSRTIYNPIQKDTVTFIKTCTDTNGEFTLVEVELENGGGVGLHYHKTYSEKFDCIEGEVQVQLGKSVYKLQPGQSATAEPNMNHLFRNRSGKPCKFLVELMPASRGFEQSLQIGYGLANDGLTKSNGFPKDKLALAWLFDISESNLPGWMSLFEFILRWQAKKARKKQLDKQLIEKYVKF